MVLIMRAFGTGEPALEFEEALQSLLSSILSVRNCSVNESHCLLRSMVGTRWPRVAKVWFESTSRLYHGKFNYDRR